MNEEVKQKWADALRSDKYEQLMGTLYESRDGVVRCCVLGALNDISELGRWVDGMYVVEKLQGYAAEDYFSGDLWTERVFEEQNRLPELRKFIQSYLDDGYVRQPTPSEVDKMSAEVAALYQDCVRGEEELLHSAVKEWAGLDDKDPEVEFMGKTYRIHELNDAKQLTFNELANLIEEQL